MLLPNQFNEADFKLEPNDEEVRTNNIHQEITTFDSNSDYSSSSPVLVLDKSFDKIQLRNTKSSHTFKSFKIDSQVNFSYICFETSD